MGDSESDSERKEMVERKEINEKTIEEKFVQLTDLEFVWKRPDVYVGNMNSTTEKIHVINSKLEWEERETEIVPALLKIIDEVMVNVYDAFFEALSAKKDYVTMLQVKVDQKKGSISISNNGRVIPVVIHKKNNVYLPEFIFGMLRTSTNYDDTNKKRLTGGRNGLGAKLANIFSVLFRVTVSDAINKKHYVQEWTSNMTKRKDPVITNYNGTDSRVCIEFTPDWKRFKLNATIDSNLMDWMRRRTIDIVACANASSPNVDKKKTEADKKLTHILTATFNDVPLPKIVKFVDYAKLWSNGSPNGWIIQEDDHWNVAISLNPEMNALQHVAFVNGVHTYHGGTHVDHVVKQLVEIFRAKIVKKTKGDVARSITTLIKRHLKIIIFARIYNPAFDTQTKSRLNTPINKKKSGQLWEPSSKFLKQLLHNDAGILPAMILAVEAFQLNGMDKKTGKRQALLKNGLLDNLLPARFAGTKRSNECTLFLTEGNSAAGLANAGREMLGTDIYGVFPLRGKVINVSEGASMKQIADNKEITAIIIILGLEIGLDYSLESARRTMKYRRVIFFMDRDFDGFHIQGLLMNFFRRFWPALLQSNDFIFQFLTPVIVAKRKKERIPFYSVASYTEWKQQQPSPLSGWNIKYYKGLGTSTRQEAKDFYFADMDKHLIPFRHDGENDFKSLELFYGKEHANLRKQWLSSYCGDHLDYTEGLSSVSYSDFVDKELIMFAEYNNQRMIASSIDGLKMVQRKILFACRKRKLWTKEVKVMSLIGYVIEKALYHHGDSSLASSIINMAQDFMGANNLNYLVPSGLFGTRLDSGDDASQPRYINTKLNGFVKFLIRSEDDVILDHGIDEGMVIEPTTYFPIIPMILVNGSSGIGSAWACKILPRNPFEIINLIRSCLRNPTYVSESRNLKTLKIVHNSFIPSASLITKSRTTQFTSLSRLKTLKKEGEAKEKVKLEKTSLALSLSLVNKSQSNKKDNRQSSLPPPPPPLDHDLMIPLQAQATQSSSSSSSDTKIKQEKGEEKKEVRKIPDNEQYSIPWYNKFAGTVKSRGAKGWLLIGNHEVIKSVKVSNKEMVIIKVTEIPPGISTLKIKTLYESWKKETKEISDFNAINTDPIINFELTMTPTQFDDLQSSHKNGLMGALCLESKVTENMVAFNSNGQIHKYENVQEIFDEYFSVRLRKYDQRRARQLEILQIESLQLDEKARFVLLVATKKLEIRSRKRSDIVIDLQKLKFQEGHIKLGKKGGNAKKRKADDDADDEEDEEEEGNQDQDKKQDEKKNKKKKNVMPFAHLLQMQMESLTEEKSQQLQKEAAAKRAEYDELSKITSEMVWLRELDELEKAIQKHYREQADEMLQGTKNEIKKKKNPTLTGSSAITRKRSLSASKEKKKTAIPLLIGLDPCGQGSAKRVKR